MYSKILIATFVLLCVTPLVTYAASSFFSNGGFTTPFGGKVAAVVPCTDGALAVYLTKISAPLPYIIRPTSVVYRYGPPTPGRNILGLATNAGGCVIGAVFTPGREVLYYGTSIF